MPQPNQKRLDQIEKAIVPQIATGIENYNHIGWAASILKNNENNKKNEFLTENAYRAVVDIFKKEHIENITRSEIYVAIESAFKKHDEQNNNVTQKPEIFAAQTKAESFFLERSKKRDPKNEQDILKKGGVHFEEKNGALHFDRAKNDSVEEGRAMALALMKKYPDGKHFNLKTSTIGKSSLAIKGFITANMMHGNRSTIVTQTGFLQTIKSSQVNKDSEIEVTPANMVTWMKDEELGTTVILNHIHTDILKSEQNISREELVTKMHERIKMLENGEINGFFNPDPDRANKIEVTEKQEKSIKEKVSANNYSKRLTWRLIETFGTPALDAMMTPNSQAAQQDTDFTGIREKLSHKSIYSNAKSHPITLQKNEDGKLVATNPLVTDYWYSDAYDWFNRSPGDHVPEQMQNQEILANTLIDELYESLEYLEKNDRPGDVKNSANEENGTDNQQKQQKYDDAYMKVKNNVFLLHCITNNSISDIINAVAPEAPADSVAAAAGQAPAADQNPAPSEAGRMKQLREKLKADLDPLINAPVSSERADTPISQEPQPQAAKAVENGNDNNDNIEMNNLRL